MITFTIIVEELPNKRLSVDATPTPFGLGTVREQSMAATIANAITDCLTEHAKQSGRATMIALPNTPENQAMIESQMKRLREPMVPCGTCGKPIKAGAVACPNCESTDF